MKKILIYIHWLSKSILCIFYKISNLTIFIFMINYFVFSSFINNLDKSLEKGYIIIYFIHK
jgi:hypothetical protein